MRSKQSTNGVGLSANDGHVSQCLVGEGGREEVALSEDYTAEKENHCKLVREVKRDVIEARWENPAPECKLDVIMPLRLFSSW